jgi:hypothetical protein
MLRLSECINEGFFGNGYDRYKRKVLDALASIGIVIDEDKMKKAEDWIRDFYADKMNAYDCASAVRDEFRRYRAPVTEAFENYATEIINSAPQSKRKNAVELIKSMDNIKKAHFDHCIMSIAEKKKMDPKGVVKARGFDIMELVNDGKQAPSQIVDSISRQLLDTKEPMSVQEALEIIRESGKRIDESAVSCSDWMDMVKMELIKLGYGPVTANSYVTDEWRADIIQNFKDGYTPKEAAESLNRFLEEQERDES